jgi:hypothetical protein
LAARATFSSVSSSAGPASVRRRSAAPKRRARLRVRRRCRCRYRCRSLRVSRVDHAGHVAVADQADRRAGLAHGLDQRAAWRGRSRMQADHRSRERPWPWRPHGYCPPARRRYRPRRRDNPGRQRSFPCRRPAHKAALPFSAIEITASEFGRFLAQSVVPSSGSSAMSTSGLAVADLLADIEHRRFVALAFADHHGAAIASRLSS